MGGVCNWINFFHSLSHRTASIAWGEILSTEGEGAALDSASHDVAEGAGRRLRRKSGRASKWGPGAWRPEAHNKVNKDATH